jgi:hypothetical protein
MDNYPGEEILTLKKATQAHISVSHFCRLEALEIIGN